MTGTVPADPRPDAGSPYRGGAAEVVVGPTGDVANRVLVEHGARLQPRLHRVTDAVHVLVGHGMSNGVLVIGPDGALVVDSGEGVEEATAHRDAFRSVTDAPVRAVLYSHSHYCHGTQVWFDEPGPDPEVWGHHRIVANLADVGAEILPTYARGAMTQFGFFLPREGPDSMSNQGLGPFFFREGRATPGFVAPTRTITGETTTRLAGLEVTFVPAPSDSDDTVIIWIPELDVVVNNHVWPVLFNVYTLRGEPYRDPRAHIAAIDRIRAMDPEHLVGVHGPPISGRDEVRRALDDHRDALQFLWDQTVRGMNAGIHRDELAATIELPRHLRESPYVPECYGEVPYHVRAIHDGIVGWCSLDGADLHPLPPAEEARRIVEGFGGRDEVLARARSAIDAGEWSWALTTTTWLCRVDPTDDDARLAKAAALRGMARVTTAANTRGVCLTQALDLEGAVDVAAATPRRPSRFRVLSAPPGRFVEALRVQLDPAAAAEVDERLAVTFTDAGVTVGLHQHRGVCRYLPDGAADADVALALTLPSWADLASGRTTLAAAVDAGDVEITVGSLDAALAFFARFDHTTLA